MCRSGGSLGQIPKPGHLQTRGFCVHPGSLDPFNRRHSRAAGHFTVALSFDLAKRTYFGTDGTEPQRSGVLGYIIDGLEGLLGFFGLVILPAMAAATLYHWIFD